MKPYYKLFVCVGNIKPDEWADQWDGCSPSYKHCEYLLLTQDFRRKISSWGGGGGGRGERGGLEGV